MIIYVGFLSSELVHAIFGGFIAGLIIPHEGGFAIALVEKLEDLVTLLLIPTVSDNALKVYESYSRMVVLCIVRFKDQHGIARHWYVLLLHLRALCLTASLGLAWYELLSSIAKNNFKPTFQGLHHSHLHHRILRKVLG